MEEMYAACAKLRFAEGLRRGAAQARAETAVQEAVALSTLLGARVGATELRSVIGGRGDDPRVNVALGVWRAVWDQQNLLPPLNQRHPDANQPIAPWPGLIARWHRDICSYSVASGQLASDEVAKPQRLQAIQALANPQGDATAHAANVWRQFIINPPFAYGSEVVGAIAAKRILATTGVEPTGVAVLGAVAASNPGAVSALADDPQLWLDFFVRSVTMGCERGIVVSRWVQAGRLPTD